MSRGRGPYFQLVRSYREEGKVRQEVLVHLGTHEEPEDALAAWPSELEHLRKIGREGQAAKLEANLKKLRALTEAEEGKGWRWRRLCVPAQEGWQEVQLPRGGLSHTPSGPLLHPGLTFYHKSIVNTRIMIDYRL